MKRGWFKESYRHYLAAKGVSTAKYMVRKPKTPSYARGPAQRKKGTPVNAPDPESRGSKIQRAGGVYPIEELMKRVFIKRLPEGEQKKYFDAEGRLEDLTGEIQELESDLIPVLRLKKQKESLMKIQKDETDPDMRDEFQRKIEELDEEIDIAKESAKRERLSQLKKEKSQVLDEIDRLSGVGRRAVVNPGGLTLEQLRSRASKVRPPETVALMSRAELQQLVAEENPVLRPRGTTLKNEREKIRAGVERFQQKVKRVQPAGAAELQTAPIPPSERKQTLVSDMDIGKRKDVLLAGSGARGTTEQAVQRVKEREERQKAALDAARETRRLNAVSKKVQVDLEGAAKEAKELRESGDVVPVKKIEKDEK